jgi:serine/threonine-protein kinase
MSSVDARSDLYALGIILYEMLAGAHPFDAAEPAQLFMQQRTQKPSPIAERAPGTVVPPQLEAVVMRLLQKNPKERYQTAAEVIAALNSATMSAALDAAGSMASIAGAPPALGAVDERPPSKPAAPPPPRIAPPPPRAAPLVPLAALPLPPSTPQPPLDGAPLPAAVPPPRAAPPPAAASAPDAPPPAVQVLPARPTWNDRARTWIDRARTWTDRARARIEKSNVVVRVRALVRERPAAGYALVAAAGVVALSVVVAVVAGIARGCSGPPPGRSEAVLEPVSPGAPLGPASPTLTDDEAAQTPDGSAHKIALRAAARAKDWSAGIGAAVSLMKTDPPALRDREVRGALLACLVGEAQRDAEAGDKVLESFAGDMGVVGLDAVYDVARWRRGTKAAQKAKEILHRNDVLARMPPELRVLVDLADTSCLDKGSMFSRVAAEGDLRALYELWGMRDEKCARRDPCCYKDSGELARAISALRARVKDR